MHGQTVDADGRAQGGEDVKGRGAQGRGKAVQTRQLAREPFPLNGRQIEDRGIDVLGGSHDRLCPAALACGVGAMVGGIEGMNGRDIDEPRDACGSGLFKCLQRMIHVRGIKICGGAGLVVVAGGQMEKNVEAFALRCQIVQSRSGQAGKHARKTGRIAPHEQQIHPRGGQQRDKLLPDKTRCAGDCHFHAMAAIPMVF